MASFRNTMKHCMLEYPTVFPNPVDVCTHLFAVNGNGYHWVNGQLVDRLLPRIVYRDLKMKYPKRSYPEGFSIDLISDEIKLQNKARNHQLKWIENNLEAILDGSPIAVYFGTHRNGYLTKHVCTKYADGLNFPDDIKRDWASALYSFLTFWIGQIRREYGSEPRPQDIIQASKDIVDARTRLHPKVHNGQTFEQYQAEIDKLFSSLTSVKKVN